MSGLRKNIGFGATLVAPIGKVVRRIIAGRATVALLTLVTALAMLLYLYSVRPVYSVRGSIESRAGASAFRETTANPPSASDLDALASAAVSDEVLSEAIKSVDQSAFSVIGANQRALVGLRTNLHVKVDAVAGKVEIEMTSKFPHEASRLVDSVINTLLSSNNPAINLGDGSATQNLKSIYLGIPANPDVNPIGPSRSMLLLTAAGAGLILGIALVLVRASLDRRIVSPAQILEWTGLQTAGFLPTLPRRSSPAGRSLAAHIDPTSEAAHSCRALLLNLFGGRVNEQRGSVLVTSPSPGEGRSTVALNLAATLALAGEPVLLVDADMHSPIQHKLLTQADAQLGFCEALDNPSAATEFVRSTHVPNLFLLPRGNLSSTSAARLHGRNAGVVINELRSRYRYILFDSGPVLTNPDTTALAVRCNATILVLNAQKTSLQKAAQAKQLLTRHRAKVSAAIVNDLRNDQRRANFTADAPRLAPRPDVEESYSNVHDYGLVA